MARHRTQLSVENNSRVIQASAKCSQRRVFDRYINKKMDNVKAFKRKMLLWTSNWSQEDRQSLEEIAFTPDAVEIASLLQATGFRMRFMDQCLPKEMHPVPGVPLESPACRVIVMCPKSGIRMELDAPTSACKCPSDYSATGCNEQKMVSLVPGGGAEISKSVSELMGGLFHVMSLFPDQNHNDVRAAPAFQMTSSSSSPLKTPATGIAVVTPNAPCGPKASADTEDSKNLVPGRYRSLDTLISSGGCPDDLPEPGQLTTKDEAEAFNLPETHMEVDPEINTTYTQGSGSATKKFISKSSPAVNCSEEFFEDPSTFKFDDDKNENNEEEGNDTNEETATVKKRPRPLRRKNTYSIPQMLASLNVKKNEQVDAGRSQRIASSLDKAPISKSSVLITKLQQIQHQISDLMLTIADDDDNVSNIGEVSKTSKAVSNVVQRMVDRVRPIRCLSDFGSVPNLSRSGGTVRSIPRPKSRRYSTMQVMAPATPTTSRRRGGAVVNDHEKKGSNITVQQIGANRNASNCGTAGSHGTSTSQSPKICSKDKEALVSLNRKAADNGDAKNSNLPPSGIPKLGSIRKI